jgi:hypothetical protein
MKTLKFNLILFLVTAGFMFLISSCCKDDQTNPPQPNTTIQKEATTDIDLLTPATDLVESAVLEMATLDAEFSITEKAIPEDEIINIELNEQTSVFCCVGKKETNMTKFLNSLKLTRDQMILLKAAINDYKLCRNELNIKIKGIYKEILTKANDQRTLLMRQYKAGEITDRELKSSLENLNQRIKNALKESLSKLNINEYFKKCYRAYMENVKLILSPEQWKKWVEWYKVINTKGTKR